MDWSKKEVVLEAVKRNGGALEYASEELRGDKEVVLEAVKRNGGALEYASEELRGDKEVVLEAVKQDGHCLRWASEELKADKELLMETVKTNPILALNCAGKELDKNIAMEAVKSADEYLVLVLKRIEIVGLLSDKDIVMEALKKEKDLLSSYAFEMYVDKEVLSIMREYYKEQGKNNWQQLCEHGLQAIEREGEDVFVNIEKLMNVASKDSSMFAFSYKMSCDKDFVITALKKGFRFDKDFPSTRWFNNKDFILEAMKIDETTALTLIGTDLLKDRDFILQAVQQGGRVSEDILRKASKELQGDKEVVMEAVKQNGYALKFASEELRGDKEFILEAIKQNPLVLSTVNEELRGDRELVLEAVKRYGGALSYASEELTADKEVVKEAIKSYPMALSSASKQIRDEDEELISFALEELAKKRTAMIENEDEPYDKEYLMWHIESFESYCKQCLRLIKDREKEKTELEQKDEEATALAEEEADLDEKLEQARTLEEEYKNQLPKEQEIDDTEHEDK